MEVRHARRLARSKHARRDRRYALLRRRRIFLLSRQRLGEVELEVRKRTRWPMAEFVRAPRNPVIVRVQGWADIHGRLRLMHGSLFGGVNRQGDMEEQY